MLPILDNCPLGTNKECFINLNVGHEVSENKELNNISLSLGFEFNY